SDNCGAAPSLVFSDVTLQGACPQAFTITRTWTATDATGNTSNCVQTISVIDDTAPVITCPPNVFIECTASTLPANTGSATAIDNCDLTLSITSSDVIVPSQNCLQSYTILRTWTTADDCGNNASCVQTINIVDTTPPGIFCPPDVTIACGANTLPANTGTANATDACDPFPVITFTDVTIPGNGCPSITRTWTAEDECGNISTCVQTITVTNVTILTIQCPGDITVQCANQVPAANINLVIASSNCVGTIVVTFVNDVVSGQTCSNRFVITRTYMAADACGTTATCAQAITVFDNTPPSIACPPNITVQCASQVPAADPAGIVTADNCGGLATVSFIGENISNLLCANNYIVTRTYRATDACGNFIDCNQTITVFDNTPPSITCPGNITVQCATQVPVANPAAIVTADNCGGVATVTFAGDIISNFVCTNQYIVNRTYLAADACGNTAICNQQITVFDNSAISILCPGNVTVSCASQVPPVLNLGVVTNACGGTSTVSLVSAVISNQTCTNRFTLTRTYLATDACAQSASCVQIITVLDNTPPSITLPNGLVNGSSLDVQCYGQDPNWDLPVFGISDVSTTDNCTGGVTVTFAQVIEDEGTCATDGFINLFRLTWTATDECGNSSTAFLFMALIDTIPPVIHGIPADITVNCDSIPLPPTIVFATDECLCACVLFVSETQPIAGCADGQVILRTWTAKDRCGNQTTETQRITLVNNQPPTLQLLQPEMTGLIDGSTLEYTCSEGGIPAYINVLSAVSIVSTSTCGDAVNVTFDRKVTDANNCDFSGYIQQQILHWEAVDLCGNVAEMTVTVNLIDNQAPELIGVPSLACIDDPSLANVDAIDNCGEAHVRFWDNTIPNPCGSGTAVRRTYEAYDDCGNMVRDTAILIPNDLAKPNLEFVNPMLDSLGAGEVILLNCAAHDLQMTLFGTQDVVSNNPCAEPVNLSFAETLLSSGDCSAGSNVALMQLLWTATDVCGNLSTLTAIASVEDQASPVFVDFRAVVGIGCNDSLPVYVALDNCGSVNITTSDRYFYNDACASKYTIERVVTATDPCGNATVALQTINVGGGGPVITGVTEEICDDLSMPNVNAFDECAGAPVDVTMVQDTLEAACRGLVIQRTWTAVDACGDTTTLIQHIFIGDTIAPVILIPSYSILLQFLDVNHNVVYLSQQEWMKKIAAFDENTISVSDDCGLVIIPEFTLVVTHEDCLLTGVSEHRIYTWVATDACGNSSSLSITIDIIDDMPPVITGVPNDTTIVCAPLPVVSVAHADDTALPTSIVYTETISPDDGSGIFIVTRTWTATDACGNISVVVQHIKWIPNSLLTCNINVPAQVECNSHNVIITSDVTGGSGPFTYVWQIVGNKCFIQGGQGTPEITIYMGWEDVKIILTVTDSNGCVSMCMYVLHCLEPGELAFSANPGVANPEANSNIISVAPGSVLNQEQGVYLKDLNLWPNPAKGTVNLSFASSVEQEVEFSFVNFLGQVILTDRMDVHKGINSRTIDIDKIAGGSYLMEVKSDKEMLTKVVVIMPRD
ncbi:MAG: T9SS type A sorting domain-containing protein, partial [Saprospiraceae bacterium]